MINNLNINNKEKFSYYNKQNEKNNIRSIYSNYI